MGVRDADIEQSLCENNHSYITLIPSNRGFSVKRTFQDDSLFFSSHFPPTHPYNSRLVWTTCGVIINHIFPLIMSSFLLSSKKKKQSRTITQFWQKSFPKTLAFIFFPPPDLLQKLCKDKSCHIEIHKANLSRCFLSAFLPQESLSGTGCPLSKVVGSIRKLTFPMGVNVNSLSETNKMDLTKAAIPASSLSPP